MLNKCSLFWLVGLEKKNNSFISNETVIQKKLEYANRIKILFSYIIVTRLKALMQELVLLSLLTLIKQIKEFLASLLWGNCSDIIVAFYLTPPQQSWKQKRSLKKWSVNETSTCIMHLMGMKKRIFDRVWYSIGFVRPHSNNQSNNHSNINIRVDIGMWLNSIPGSRLWERCCHSNSYFKQVKINFKLHCFWGFLGL